MIPKIKLLIFDVNETLLDLSPLRDAINKTFTNSTAFDRWFGLLLQYSLVETVTGQYKGFGEIGKATLQMVSESQKVSLTDSEIEHILGLIKKLPPHQDVIPSLERLKALNIPLVVLTNGTLDVVKEQLKFAGIAHYFNRIFSVESAQAFKPHQATYQFVLDEMRMKASDAMLIACHAWDITGAQRAGLQGCFIARDGRIAYPLEIKPFITEKNLIEATRKILKM